VSTRIDTERDRQSHDIELLSTEMRDEDVTQTGQRNSSKGMLPSNPIPAWLARIVKFSSPRLFEEQD